MATLVPEQRAPQRDPFYIGILPSKDRNCILCLTQVITKDIWQAPTPIFKSDFPTPKPVYNRDRFLVSAAAEETIIQPTPIYSSQLPSYLFEGDIFQSGTRLLRTRSTSWSTPIRPPGFESSPKRLLSPPFEKKTTDLGEIILKQEKAKEFREMLVAAKLKKQNEKVCGST